MSDTPLTDAADDVTMRFSARHERLKELCKTLEAKLAENTGFKAIGYVHKALGCTSTVYEKDNNDMPYAQTPDEPPFPEEAKDLSALPSAETQQRTAETFDEDDIPF